MNVGYVGLGSMGGGIVKRMLVNKQPLRVYDLDPKKV
jgi:3-hydroxyisobutyrate dehydrogenase-like beta-hydroxyacid dehydrogenase